MSEWVATHLPCPSCGSSDAYSINDRGWGKCFSCGVNKPEEGAEGMEHESKPPTELTPVGSIQALPKRRLTEETCRKFGYFITEYKGRMAQVAPYRDASGKLVAQKLRFADKKMKTLGEFREAALFGQHLWGDKGKRVVITEGEIDAMSVSQAQGNKWPVVSIQNGAQAAKKSLARQLQWLMGFDEIVLMFDMDDPGREAAAECVKLFPPGKCKVAELPRKDPNEMLIHGEGPQIVSAIWQAKEVRPPGVVLVDDILEDIEKPIEKGLPYFLESLTELTHGRRWGEVITLGAGTGVGKTDLLTQQIAFDVQELGEKVGAIFLEQKPTETGKRIAGKIAGQRFHVPDAGWTNEELRETTAKLRGKVIFYDSWGDTEWEAVRDHMRYLNQCYGVRIFYLDHLTAMADTSNEKESLEQIMKELAGLANELQLIVHLVSHLTTPEGKPHEEGGRVTIRQFKGSRSIGFWSYFMFGLERNQQEENEELRSITTFRVLKDRYTGQATGHVIHLKYDPETGLLSETEMPTTAKSQGFQPEGPDGEGELPDF